MSHSHSKAFSASTILGAVDKFAASAILVLLVAVMPVAAVGFVIPSL